MRFHPVSAQFLPLVYSGTRAARAAFGLSHCCGLLLCGLLTGALQSGERFRPLHRRRIEFFEFPVRTRQAFRSVRLACARFSPAHHAPPLPVQAPQKAPRADRPPAPRQHRCRSLQKLPVQRLCRRAQRSRLSRSFQPLCAAPLRNQRAPVQAAVRSPLLRTAPQAPDVCASRTPDMAHLARA